MVCNDQSECDDESDEDHCSLVTEASQRGNNSCQQLDCGGLKFVNLQITMEMLFRCDYVYIRETQKRTVTIICTL